MITPRNFIRATVAAALLAAAPVDAQGFSRPRPIDYRGCNYFPAATLGISNALGMLSASGVSIQGTYSPNQVAIEIAQLAKAGINSLRIFPSFYGWLTHPADYMANLKHLANQCRIRGIVITYVMWNTTSNVFTPNYTVVDPNPNTQYDAGLHSTLQAIASTYTLSGSGVPYPAVLQFGEPWQFVLHDQPGNGLFEAPFNGVMSSWPNNMRQKCENYVQAIGNFFANDPDGKAAYGSYDLFNEPDCCGLAFSNQVELMAMTYKRLSRQHSTLTAPEPEFTVGFADYNMSAVNNALLTSVGIKQTYVSYHCYEFGSLFTTIADTHQRLGSALNLPVVCSEFYDKNKVGHLGGLGSLLGTLDARGIAGNSWVYLATNLIIRSVNSSPPGSFIRFDGMVIPTALPSTSYASPLTFSLAPGAVSDVLALKSW